MKSGSPEGLDAESAASEGWDNAEFVAWTKRRLLILEESNILLIDENENASANPSFGIEQAIADAVKPVVQLPDGSRDTARGHRDDFLTATKSAERGWNNHVGLLRGHGGDEGTHAWTSFGVPAANKASNSRRLGLISRVCPT